MATPKEHWTVRAANDVLTEINDLLVVAKSIVENYTSKDVGIVATRLAFLAVGIAMMSGGPTGGSPRYFELTRAVHALLVKEGFEADAGIFMALIEDGEKVLLVNKKDGG